MQDHGTGWYATGSQTPAEVSPQGPGAGAWLRFILVTRSSGQVRANALVAPMGVWLFALAVGGLGFEFGV